jgi:hypothetical protein
LISKIHISTIFPPDIGQKIERIFPHAFKEVAKRTEKEEI